MMTEIKILTQDHYMLSARHFIPADPNGHVVIINSATGVKQNFYGHFAAYLASQGHHVYTYDYRGIGGSRGGSLKNFEATIADWGELDLTAVIKYVRQRHPIHSISIVGHSIGGQIIGLSPLSSIVDSIVMVGAQTPFWRHYRGTMLLKVWHLWHVMIPILTGAFGYFPARSLGLFEDLPRAAALQWARWGKSRNYLFDELPEKKELFSSLQQPALVYSFTDDQFAPRDAVDDLLSHYSNLNIEHRHINPISLNRKSIGHFNFFRKSSEGIFWSKISDWLKGAREKKLRTQDSYNEVNSKQRDETYHMRDMRQ
ncbi:MAG TPA: alpha/beta fold hydrolase [Cyclobacteriaceae bacterium]|nr:alpha/beta fold hydrolase [Cyclobacteriaceae bacterium]